MALNIRWGNSLEALADNLLAKLGEDKVVEPAEVFVKRDCIVVSNRIQQAWLQQRFLYDSPRITVPHVLANCDFPLLSLFVNDWLYRMQTGDAASRPDPERHPFSVKSMRWMIYDFLMAGNLDGVFVPLQRYVLDRSGAKRDARKCFKLAGQLAALMDQYVTYRPQMMVDWEAGRDEPTDLATAWEPALWRRLIQGRENRTYLAAYRRMKAELKGCGIGQPYRRIFNFAPSMLPPAHLEFFRLLGEIVSVDFYLFNPSQEDWFDRDSLKKLLKGPGLLDRPADDGELLDVLHPLLGAYARGSRDLTAAALDLTGGQIGDEFVVPEPDSVLHALQRSLADCDGSMGSEPREADGSIQIHLCHGKMREVEILRDQLLKCFDEMDGLQPRDIQVQVADLDAYAPYVEAVFFSANPNAPDAIPFAIADRVAAGESRAAEAFRQLLELADSRFSAPELLELLRYDGVARRFGFEPDEVNEAALWLNQAGVRWGRDSAHRESVSHAAFAEETTWRHGLDRLILGYAMGQEKAPSNPAGLFPRDCVEGDGAVRLGGLARFYDMVSEFAEYGRSDHTPEEWATRLETLLDDFFVSDNDTYRDVGVLKSAVRLLRTSGETAGFEKAVPIAVVRDFLAGHLGETTGGSDLNRNVVIFSSLRPGSSTPRKIQCLLGMGDGLFPRTDNRPAYDLLRGARKMGDRSASLEDRLAFLEVLMNARTRLLISFPAFSEEDNAPACESVAVRELTEYLDRRFGTGKDAVPVLKMKHRLQPWHPAYFGGDPQKHPDLFSYSRHHCAAAKSALAGNPPASKAPAIAKPAQTLGVELKELIDFFDNPAKFYYKRILGAEPQPLLDNVPADTETFEPDSLDKWKVRDRMLKSFVEDETEEELEFTLKEFVADGTIPLGKWGEQWLRDLSSELEVLLGKPAPPFGTLREALMAQKMATSCEWVVPIDVDGVAVALSGAAPLIDGSRYARFPLFIFQGAAAFATWLTHLLAAAAGGQVTSINVQGTDKLKITELSPLVSPDQAKIILADYLRLFFFHPAPPLPITPDAAWAYVDKLGGTEDQHKAALEAAGKIWNPGTNYVRGDYQDAYYAAYFGSAGPLAKEAQFVEIAKR
jgi:exodeoxyribonuclease V gamma subunit